MKSVHAETTRERFKNLANEKNRVETLECQVDCPVKCLMWLLNM